MALEFKSPYIREDHIMFREMCKEFTDKELRPKAADHDRTGNIDRALLKKMADQGFMGMAIPEEYGGTGADPISFAILAEELSRGCASSCVVLGAHAGIGTYGILIDGTDMQKKKYLPGMATFDNVGCFCLTEPQAGSDAAGIKTRAV